MTARIGITRMGEDRYTIRNLETGKWHRNVSRTVPANELLDIVGKLGLLFEDIAFIVLLMSIRHSGDAGVAASLYPDRVEFDSPWRVEI